MGIIQLVKKHSPTILTIVAAIGTVATAVLSAKDTPKALMAMYRKEGEAEGELTLSTADIKPLLQAAANAGMIPSQAVVLADTVFKKLATHRETGASATDSDASAPVAPELRLPLTFADGKTHLGPLPLGPAPLFPR